MRHQTGSRQGFGKAEVEFMMRTDGEFGTTLSIHASCSTVMECVSLSEQGSAKPFTDNKRNDIHMVHSNRWGHI